MKSNGILFAFHSVSRACGVNNSFSQNKNKLTVRHTMDALIQELKIKLITLLNLQDLTSENFDADAQLVGGELGIDSIDVLEMVVMVEKDYGIVINNQEVGQQVFSSLRSLATYIENNLPDKNV
jgi:acyl carrier protein